ncbi:MAG: methyltransferase domain-containing protein [Pseudomonadota bacterium]
MSLPRSFAARTPPHALPERMDTLEDEATLHACLKSLARVNRWSLGHGPTVRFVASLAAREGAPLRVLDVGSGYGDGLRALARGLARRGIRANLTGADLNPLAGRLAASVGAPPRGIDLRYITADARTLAIQEPFDVITCSLFTHHLEDDEVVAFLRLMDGAARRGWFINDLYRSRFAAVGFGALATVLRQHPIVRHDGPVSFARAFRRRDWSERLAEASVHGATTFIGAPFRLCVGKVHGPG